MTKLGTKNQTNKSYSTDSKRIPITKYGPKSCHKVFYAPKYQTLTGQRIRIPSHKPIILREYQIPRSWTGFSFLMQKNADLHFSEVDD